MLLAFASVLLGLQSPTWVEQRFDRVHLRNGNFIDGQILRNAEDAILLRLTFGEMTIRRDTVTRVETVRIRRLEDAPEEVKPPTLPSGPAAPERPVPPEPEPPAGREPPPPNERVDRILERLRAAPTERKYDVMQLLLGAGPGTAAYLADRLEGLDDASRSYIANALVLMKDRASMPAILTLAGSKNPSIRTHAADILGAIGGQGVAAPLRRLLQDADSVVRAAAVGALQTISDRDSFSAVAALASDPDRGVRTRALAAASELARAHDLQDPLVSALSAAARRAQGETKAEALLALGKAGGKEAWAEIAEYLSDSAAPARAAAATALMEIGAEESEEALVARLPVETDSYTREQLASAALRLKSTKAVGPLISWLRSENAVTRMAAARVLPALTGQRDFGSDPEAWETWWEKAKPSD